MEEAKAARKEALKTIHAQVQVLPDEDLSRVQKMVRAELRARGSLASLQSEIDGAADEDVQRMRKLMRTSARGPIAALRSELDALQAELTEAASAELGHGELAQAEAELVVDEQVPAAPRRLGSARRRADSDG
jgi:hypothetical protein